LDAEKSSLRLTPTVIAVEKVCPAVCEQTTEKIVQSRSSSVFPAIRFSTSFSAISSIHFHASEYQNI
jgi:hypothetical protein